MGLGLLVFDAIRRFLIKLGAKKAFRWAKRWYYHNVRGEKTPREERDRLREEVRRKEMRIESKEGKIETQSQEISNIRRNLSIKERLMESLEMKGISRQELFRKNLENPTPFLIFRTGGQIPEGKRPEDDEEHGWVRNKLEDEFGAKTVASSYVIPPEHFPESLLSGKYTLAEWIDEELYEEDVGRWVGKDDFEGEVKANFTYVNWVDLEKGELFWRREYDAGGMPDMEDRFDMDKLVEADFYDFDQVKDALQLVKKGDVAFFSAKFVDENEIRRIHENQTSIEEMLGQPSLKELAQQTEIGDIQLAFEEYVSDPENVASGVKQEAKIWYDELYGSGQELDGQLATISQIYE